MGKECGFFELYSEKCCLKGLGQYSRRRTPRIAVFFAAE
jgi:hypothetical protein